MLVTLDKSPTLTRELQPINALLLIFVILDKLIDFKDEQFWNALFHISVTFDKSSIDSKDEQPWNAPFSINVTLPNPIIFVNDLQLTNINLFT